MSPWQLLRDLVEQIELSNAVDDHGHKLIHLQAFLDAKEALKQRSGK